MEGCAPRVRWVNTKNCDNQSGRAERIPPKLRVLATQHIDTSSVDLDLLPFERQLWRRFLRCQVEVPSLLVMSGW